MSSKMQSILHRRLAQKEAQSEVAFRSSGSSDSNPRLQELVIILRRLFLRAHASWARYATSLFGKNFLLSTEYTFTTRNYVVNVGEELKNSIWEDDWADSEKKKMWHGTTVAVEAAVGGAQEEAIPLPYQPSTYVLSFLFSVCKEIHRVSAHTPDKVFKDLTVNANHS